MKLSSVALAVGALALAACGGSSSSSSSGGGSGGTSTGGVGGGVGGVGGGVGGSSGGAAGASGGAAGAGALGGSGGVAGSGTGGSATGGAAGSGGSVGDNCTPLCTALVAANCSNGPTQAGCLLTCKALTSSASCDATAQAYFTCAASATIACNGVGEPAAQGCGVKYLAAIGCAVQASPNQTMVDPCNTYCDAVVAANCGNNGTKNECDTRCLWAGVTGTGCDGEWGAFLSCANAVTLTCLAGYAVAPGCGSTFNAYRQCINNASNP